MTGPIGLWHYQLPNPSKICVFRDLVVRIICDMSAPCIGYTG